MKLHQIWWIGSFYRDKPSLTLIAAVNAWIANFEFLSKLPAKRYSSKVTVPVIPVCTLCNVVRLRSRVVTHCSCMWSDAHTHSISYACAVRG